MIRQCAAGFVVLALSLPLGAAEPFFLRDGQRVVFLGDSITYAGHYIEHLDGYLRTRFPGQRFELLDLGLPSETVSGLSEPDHPYPRPDVHERLLRVLTRTQPDVVVACYGMNDGIYYPFAEERLRKYQDGVRRLIDQVRRAGAKVVLMTPPPFDARPLKAKVQPAAAPKFSWMAPYAGYDDVLARYGEWLLTLRKEGIPVADAHGAVARHLRAVCMTEPDYRVAGDGIHANPTGHWPIARELLRLWNAPTEVDVAEIDAAGSKVIRGQVSDLAVEGGTVRFRWLSRLPMPSDPRWDRRLAEVEQITDQVNRHRLTVRGLDRERYEVFEEGRRVGTATKEQLAAGLDLLKFPELSTNRRAAEVGKLVIQRQRLLGLAWLTDVGHKRPDTPKGMPLEEAQRRAGELDRQVRDLVEPIKLELRLAPMP